jgi:hypothetical protein
MFYILTCSFAYIPLLTSTNQYVHTDPPREFWAPGRKEACPPSSNSQNNDTQTKSTTVCHKQGITNQYNKNELMNCDLENSSLLVFLSGPLIIMIWYIY